MAARRQHHQRTTIHKQFGSAKLATLATNQDPLAEPAIAKLCQQYEQHETAIRVGEAKLVQPTLALAEVVWKISKASRETRLCFQQKYRLTDKGMFSQFLNIGKNAPRLLPYKKRLLRRICG